MEVRIRPIEVKDLHHYIRWYADPEVALGAQGYTEDLNMEIVLRRHECDRAAGRLPFGIETEDGRLIGSIGVSEYSGSTGEASVVIMIGEKEFWGRGLGAQAIRLFVDKLFSEDANLKTITARIYSFNHRSVRCFLKAGFKCERVERSAAVVGGNVVDVVVMAIRRPGG